MGVVGMAQICALRVTCEVLFWGSDKRSLSRRQVTWLGRLFGSSAVGLMAGSKRVSSGSRA